MRVLVCGSRNWTNRQLILQTLQSLQAKDSCVIVVEGEAPGADSLARSCAEQLGMIVEKYPADWTRFGKAAGPIRNQQMLDEGKPDLVVAFHENLAESRGTRDMVNRAEKAGLPVIVVGCGCCACEVRAGQQTLTF